MVRGGKEGKGTRNAIHISGDLLVCPPFGLSRVIRLATSKVITLSTFLGAIFAL